MLGPMSVEEFAELVSLDVGEIERYCANDLLDPDKDGRLDGRDILRLQYVQQELSQGAALETLAQQLSGSDNELASRLFQPVDGLLTDEGAAERVGITLDQLKAFRTALGFPPASGFDEGDMQALGLAKQMMDAGMPFEAMIEGARVYSDSLRRLADASLRMTHRYLCEALLAAGHDEREVSLQVGDAVSVISPAAQELVEHLLVDYIREAAIDHAVSHLETKAPGDAPGTEQATIVFVDVALFSSLADLEGDEAAVRLIDRVDQAVRKLSIEHAGKIIKQIGDEFMLVFREPGRAVRFAVELNETMGRTDPYLGLRTGIHTGSILYRLGDYFGRAVNVAARIVSMALPNSILVTEPVAKASADQGIAVEEIGVRELRGMAQPIAIYRVLTTREE